MFPFCRGYYRCTHRKLQACLATKQVQRSDDDPTIFEITYRGNHTCNQVSNFSTPSATQQEFQQQNCTSELNLVQSQQAPPDALLNSWASLKVITENIDTNHKPTLLFPPFSYDPKSNHEAANHVESTSVVDTNHFTEFSPSFLSPTASGSGLSYFTASSSGLSENQKLNLQTNKSELSDIFSSPTSAINSQILGLDFPFGELEMEPSFTFNNTSFFS